MMNKGRTYNSRTGRKRKKEKLSLWDILCRSLFSIILLLALGIAYLWKAQYFLDHFYDNTWINGIDCSDLQADEVKTLIQEQVDGYELSIIVRGGDEYVLTADDIDLKYVDDNGVDILLRSQEPLVWLQKTLKPTKYEVSANTSYQVKNIKKLLERFPFMDEEQMIAPMDAYLSETEDGYIIVPEVMGTTLDTKKVTELVLDAIANGRTELVLEEEECYQNPSVYQDATYLQNEVNGLNDLTRANLTYTVRGKSYVIDENVLKSWLKQYENGVYYLDPTKPEEFIEKLANERDSYGGARTFKTHEGKVITLEDNQYGWKVDREASVRALMIAVEDGKQGDIELIYQQKAQGKDNDDLGSIYVEISIGEQKMWCYKDGEVVVETSVVTGTENQDGTATPRNGCWYIYRKATKYTIKGPVQTNGEPEYTEFVQYWMPFNGNVGIHDKSGSVSDFGGEIYLDNGSKGSVQAPLDAVRQIYDVVSVGTPVIVY